MKHLDDCNLTYKQHLFFVSRIGLVMIIGGFLMLIHAIFPFLLKDTGREIFEALEPCFSDRLFRSML